MADQYEDGHECEWCHDKVPTTRVEMFMVGYQRLCRNCAARLAKSMATGDKSCTDDDSG